MVVKCHQIIPLDLDHIHVLLPDFLLADLVQPTPTETVYFASLATMSSG